MKRKCLSFLLAATMIATLAAGCGSSDDPTKNMSEEEKAAWEAVVNDPYGKYPELITYTSGYNLTNQGGDTLAGTPYENDTPSDNAYTRYVKEVLNVQNENMFEAPTGPDYDQKVSMAIASQDIPDIMYIADYATLVDLVENDMIQDLTDVYNNLACETVKTSYESYGAENNPLNTVTFDGKPTQKEAMVAMAKELERVQQKHEIMTFKVAYEKYIESKRNVLSPSTIMGYNTIIRQTPKKFLDKRVSDMTALDVQEEINLIAKKCSPKTVRNHHSLISAVLGVFSPNLKLRNCRKIIYAFCLE